MRFRPSSRTIIMTLSIILSIAATYLINTYITSSKIDKANKMVEEAEFEVNRYLAAGNTVYILAVDKYAGEVIRESDLQETKISDYITPEDALLKIEDLAGKVIKLDTSSKTILTSEMVRDGESLDVTDRITELDYVRLPIKLEQTDIIDIVIVYPNGEMYLVAGKKTMSGMDLINQMIFTTTNAEERYLLSSALVDAYINKAEIVALQYVEPELQEKPYTNYLPNLDVLKNIKADPKIVNTARYEAVDTLRAALDQRLAAIPEEDKHRVGATLPDGSAVAQRKRTVGAQISVVEPNNNAAGTGDSDEANNLPAGFTPASGSGVGAE